MDHVELVKELRNKLKKYKVLYSQNETAVREQIVSPLLKVLGWNPENPKQVIPEHSVPVDERVKKMKIKGKEGKIKLDYALMRRKLFAVVEVKALNKIEKGLGQAFANAKYTGARYIIVTDGDAWRVYDTSKPMKKALISDWSFLREKPEEIAKKINKLYKLLSS
jgi:predicted type IV restriction endonuclease